MIVSASYRTDIPAFYGDWFLQRLQAKEAWVKNPYGGRPYRVSLAPGDVDGFVFWTRNLAPFGDAIEAVAAMQRPFFVQYTITGYPPTLETGVPPTTHGANQVAALSKRFGKAAVVWRYDPVLFTSVTPPEWHRSNFAALARALGSFVDEVVVSFCTIYRKSARNLAKSAERHGFVWYDPPLDEKRAFIAELAAIAADAGLRLTVCSQSDVLATGAEPAACIDAARLSILAGRPISARQKGNRPGCLCAESRDIGGYDTCAHGCAYCYAVGDHDRARTAVRRRDDTAQQLGGQTREPTRNHADPPDR
jgi:hypothetical protein